MTTLGCGYHFSIQHPFPEGIRRLNVSMFENRTTETGLETILTNGLIDEILKNRSVALTTERDTADAFLSGVIKTIRTETISHRGQFTSDERRVSIVVEVKMCKPNGQIIWQNKSVQGQSTYQTHINKDRMITEQRRLSALKTLSNDMAENIYNQITSTF